MKFIATNSYKTTVFGALFVVLMLVGVASLPGVTLAYDYDFDGGYDYDFGGGGYDFDFGGGYDTSFDSGDYDYDFGGGYDYDFGGGYDYDFGGSDYDYNFGGDYDYDFGGDAYDYNFGGDYDYDFGGGTYDYDFGGGYDYDFGSNDYDLAFGDSVYDYDFGGGYDYDFGSGLYDYDFGGTGYDYDFGATAYDFDFGADAYDYDFGGGDEYFTAYGDEYFTPYGDETFVAYGDEYFTPYGDEYFTPYENGYVESYPYNHYAPVVVGNTSVASRPVSVGRSAGNARAISNARSTSNVRNISNVSNVSNVRNVSNARNVSNTTVRDITHIVRNATPQRIVSSHQPPIAIRPTCSIFANPTTVGYGQVATINWNTSHAQSADLSGFGPVQLNGSRVSGNITGTTVYTLTVGGPGGTNSCSTTVHAQTVGTPPVLPPVIPPVQPPIQPPLPPIAALSCTLTAQPHNIPNNASAVLSWTTQGHIASAWLSDGLGVVAPSGSLSVRPERSRSYTLTVTDFQGRTQTCATHVNVSGGAPFVSLSQVPYTGFDGGPFFNTMYWLGMVAWALGAAYIVVRYRGDMLDRVFAVAGSHRYDPVNDAQVLHEAIIMNEQSEEEATPEIEASPVKETTEHEEIKTVGTTDTLTLDAGDEGDMPVLSIARR